jgi:HSP20 family molecular chaperone IbpA
MKKMEGITSELLTSIDVLNTLNGGVVEPRVALSQHADYRQVALHVPSIPHDRVKAEIHNNQLTIYYYQQVLANGRPIRMPRVVYNKQIPYFIDSAKISANFEEDKLVVRLPFNELANGYHRDLTATR